MPTAQRIQPIVFMVRWLTIRARTVPKSPKATPALMMLAIRHGTFPSRVPITVAARIKDTQMPQTTQAIRCARPGFAIFPVTLYGDSIDVLLLSRRVKLSHAKKDSAYAYYHITHQSSQKRYELLGLGVFLRACLKIESRRFRVVSYGHDHQTSLLN